ncbi:hypothetical protein [Desulfovibrio desulfuricans]|uniref:hypothetical protein n=1 Tax=Desulfovibrio desulfuricans TaxID=876 RepID=UPI001AE91978|nr:hypothetical protein [Desulfovibrio desulfuricans]QTO39134.1 hypothetical protein J8J02_08185 [Desulfovibrio desulfuricans]
MYLLKQWVAGVAALLICLPSTGLAAGIVLKNSMGSDIKAVFCVGNNGDKKPVVEGLAKKSSKTVSPGKFPEHDCTRIGVSMQNGMGWQYYHEPEPGSAKEIEFAMDAAGRNENRKYPSMLITMSDGEAYVAPAGVPMFMLVQLMRKGLDVARWKEFALPGYEGLKEPGAYAVCFADQSWSLAGKGMKFDGKGGELETVTLSAPFANTTIGAMFEELKKNEWLPLVLEAGGQTSVFGAQGAALAPKGKTVDCSQTSDGMWQALETLFVSGAENADKPVRIVLASEGLRFAMNLDLDAALAEISLARVPAGK